MSLSLFTAEEEERGRTAFEQHSIGLAAPSWGEMSSCSPRMGDGWCEEGWTFTVSIPVGEFSKSEICTQYNGLTNG